MWWGGGQSTCSCASRKMLGPGSPCHNYPTSSRVASRPARDGRAQQKMEQRGIPRAAHRRQLPASQPKALMVDVSGRPTALRGVARRQSSPTAEPLVRSSASKLKQQKCPADRQTRATRAPRIASHRITPQRQSLSHRPLSFHRSLRGCSLPGTGTHHCEARRSTCCMHQ